MARNAVPCEIVINEPEEPVIIEHSDTWKQVIEECISSKEENLHDLSRFLWENPEPTYNEIKAQRYMCDYLEGEGFNVEKGFVVATGFRATYESPASECSSHYHFLDLDGERDENHSVEQPNVCFLCEYDSTVLIGHTAGHNLKTQSSIAAALGIKECLEKHLFKGKVTLIGTPGEDCGCGVKIKLVNEGVFADIDFCLMLSPFNSNILCPKFYTLLTVTVLYKGKAAHASAFPWDGHNALDAAVTCYNSIGLLRQQLKPSWIINGVLLSGGEYANTIPQHSQLKFWLRVPTHMDLVFIQQKCTACFVAAAKSTGCEVTMDFEDPPYYPMSHNKKLSEIYKKAAQAHDMVICEDKHILDVPIGVTDLGNVSQIVPCILPAFDIGTDVPIYSSEFHDASGSEEAFKCALNAARVLALTAAKVIASPKDLQCMIAEHYQNFGQRTPILVERVRARGLHEGDSTEKHLGHTPMHIPPQIQLKAATPAVPQSVHHSTLHTPGLQHIKIARSQSITPALLQPIPKTTQCLTPALQHIKIVRSQATTPGLPDPTDRSKQPAATGHKIQIVRAKGVTSFTPPQYYGYQCQPSCEQDITPGLKPDTYDYQSAEVHCTPGFPHIKRALSLGTD